MNGSNNQQKRIKLYTRLILGCVFFILGFNFSNTIYFRENPLFGFTFLAEVLISFASFAFGYSTLPRIFESFRMWVEHFLEATISEIVWKFWEEQTQRMQVARRQRQQIKPVKTSRFKDAIFIDTSVLIDGRILDIVPTNFISKTLVVPIFVVDEMHILSDSKDSIKREKGRRGLDVLSKLKKQGSVILYAPKGNSLPSTQVAQLTTTEVTSDNLILSSARDVGNRFSKRFMSASNKPTQDLPDYSGYRNYVNSAPEGVDKALVQLAKKYTGQIMTLDFNLNKVAKVSSIDVLNINELLDAVKFPYVPGDSFKIKIIEKGRSKKQGIGYLKDGTMVVVENTSDLVGKTLNVTVSKIIFGPAGKMAFCDVIDK
ncbi:MAG: TRAM domain-containing protein [Patescibacteria group bacterium]